MTDTISLSGLRVRGHHGVFDYERAQGQEFIVDVSLQVDTRRAARADDLDHTVNYGELADRIAAAVAGEPVNLLETLAARVAALCLSCRGTQAVEVTVHKPQAPIRHTFDDVAVTIHRTAEAGREADVGRRADSA